MTDNLRRNWDGGIGPDNRYPPTTPADARIKEAERNLAAAKADAISLIFKTPVPTETIVVPVPIRCHFCEQRPAATYTRTENGKEVYYYQSPGFISSYPLCSECKDSLERSHFDDMSC